jgi:hypothetical protein
MNESTQKRQIQKFLRGTDKRDIDVFTIYQWIDRCHIQKWWDLGMALGSHIPPNSLDSNYQKRIAFLLSECQRSMKDNSAKTPPSILKKSNRLMPSRSMPALTEIASNESETGGFWDDVRCQQDKWSQADIVDCGIKWKIPHSIIATALMEHDKNYDMRKAISRIKRHLRGDTQSKRVSRGLISELEYQEYLNMYPL